VRVTVVGLGKIGLPLAAQFASRGADVVGLDVDPRVVDLVNSGLEPFPGETGLSERLVASTANGRLRATLDPRDAVSGSATVVIVVPLVVGTDLKPDFTHLDAATRAVGAHLEPGALVCYETTLPLGTTRGRFLPMLEDLTGGQCGSRFLLAHSPERVFSGRIFADLRHYPKLVGGVDNASATAAAAFYHGMLEFDERPDLPRPNGVWDLGSAEAAEMAKLAETTYRDLNIAFANELALAGREIGVDVRSVIEACNSQPFSHVHQPGIAVGGHCIPVYPRFLLETTAIQLPRLAREINEGMPQAVVHDCDEWLCGIRDRTAVILGVAYRGGVKETAFSGAFAVKEALEKAGAIVLAHDPLYTDGELTDLGFTPYRWGASADLAIIQADHVEYSDASVLVPHPFSRVYDGRGLLAPGPGVRVLGRRDSACAG